MNQKNKFLFINGVKKSWGKKKIHIVFPGSEVYKNADRYINRENNIGEYSSLCQINAEGSIEDEISQEDMNRLCSKCREKAINSNSLNADFIIQ